MADFEDPTIKASADKLARELEEAAKKTSVFGDITEKSTRTAKQAAEGMEKAAERIARTTRAAPPAPTAPTSRALAVPQRGLGPYIGLPPGGGQLDPRYFQPPPPPPPRQIPRRTGYAPAWPSPGAARYDPYQYEQPIGPSISSQQAIAQRRRRFQEIAAERAAGAQIGTQQYAAPLRPGRPGVLPESTFGTGPLTASKAALLEHSEALKAAEVQSAKLAQANIGLGRTYEKSSIQIGSATNEARARGALTTEFIGSLARGETTIKELGYQVGATIGKFAGWTAAATAVYGAAAAFNQLYQGALKAEDGVKLVERVAKGQVDDSALKNAFQDLSTSFNVDIATSADTVYQLTKLFGGDLPSAIEASRVSLQAMQIGELDVTEATNALNSVVKGFGLNVGELQNVFNAVNAAQNQFGGNTGELLKNVAKGAAQARQAGFDYKELIALQTVAVQYGGRTPAVVSTAIQRSQARVQTTQGRDELEKIGIDPEKFAYDYSLLLAEGAKRYKAARTGPEKLEVARAFVPSSGGAGALSPIISSIFADYDKLGNVYKGVADDQKNAAINAKELAKFIEAPSQQIKRLTINLQNLGASLGEGNLLAPLYGLVRGLNFSLEATNSLVEGLNRLPSGIGKVLIPAAELLLVFKAMRALDVGRIFGRADGSRGPLGTVFGRSQEATAHKTISVGLRDTSRAGEEGLAKSTQALNVEQRKLQIALNQRAAAETARSEASAVGGKVQLAAEERYIAAAARATGLQESVNVMLIEQAALQEEALLLDARGNAYRAERNALIRQGYGGVFRKGLSEEAARRTDIGYARTGLDVPIVAGQGARQIPGQQELFPTGPVGEQLTIFPTKAAEAATEAERQIADANRRVGEVESKWTRAGAATQSFGNRLKRFGGYISGALNELILLAIAIPVIWETFEAEEERFEKVLQAGPTSSPQALVERAKEAGSKGIRDRLYGGVQGSYNLLKEGLGGVVPLGGLLPDISVIDTGARERAEKSLRLESKGLSRAQSTGALKRLGNIQAELTTTLAAAKTVQERRAAFDEAIRQAGVSLAKIHGGKVAKTALRNFTQRLEEQSKDPGVLDPGFYKKSQEEFEEFRKRYDARTELLVAQAKTPQGKARVQIRRTKPLLDDISTTYGPQSKEMIDARREQVDLLQKRFEADQALADAKLSAAVAGETDPIVGIRAQIRANGEKLAAYAKQYTTESTQYQQVLQEGRQLNQQLVQSEISRFQAQIGLQAAQRGTPATQGQGLNQAVADAQKVLAYAQAKGAGVDQIIQLQTAVAQARNAYADYLKQQAQAMIDARAAFATSQTEDPAKQGRIELNRLIAQSKYAKTPAERLTARAGIAEQRRKIRNDRQQQIADDIEFELSVGKIEKDQALQRYQSLLKHMHGNRDLRRQIQQRIKALKDETDSTSFDLEVGSLKLPSIYDVRKAFDPIREQVKAKAKAAQGGSFLRPADLDNATEGGATTNTTVNVYVNDKNDAPVVYDAVDRAVRTNVRARMRSRKLR